MAASGSSWELVDCASNGFLMDADSLRSTARDATCIVFSEVFGHTYDLLATLATPGTLRIVDMAVTVPNRALVSRLAKHDLALVSFGAGKCMTAGWGAMAFTRDPALALELKSLRASSLEGETGRLRFTRSTRILLQTSMYSRILYGPARRFHDRRDGSGRAVRMPGLSANGRGPLSGHWRSPSTHVDRSLIHHNLTRAEDYEGKRLADARRYRDNLKGVTSLRLPPCSDNALSHFTVRVSADRRDQIRRRLWKAGIDVGVYFAFPRFVSRTDYPNAQRLAAEVLNLPLGEGLNGHDIDRISEVLTRSVVEQL
jgi:dTDP-4-amino-4,6-dideoxygalactose transaminase